MHREVWGLWVPVVEDMQMIFKAWKRIIRRTRMNNTGDQHAAATCVSQSAPRIAAATRGARVAKEETLCSTGLT